MENKQKYSRFEPKYINDYIKYKWITHQCKINGKNKTHIHAGLWQKDRELVQCNRVEGHKQTQRNTPTCC